MAKRRTSRRLATRTSRPVAANGGSKRVSHRGGSDLRRVEDAARAAGWSVDRTKAGHLVFRSPDKSVPPIYTASDLSERRAIRNIETMLRRHGLETHPSRVKKNPVPPPPSDEGDFNRWALKTFKPGTRVRLLWPEYGWLDGDSKIGVPAGSIGRVAQVRQDDLVIDVDVEQPLLFSQHTDTARVFMLWPQVVGGNGPFHYPDEPEDERNRPGLEVLDDNWGPQTTRIARPYKGRYTAPNVGWKPADELRRTAALYRSEAQREGLHSDESHSLHRQAQETERSISREGRPLTAEEWLGGAEVPVPIDVRYQDEWHAGRERALDDAAPRWRPGFEPRAKPKKRRSRR